MKVAFDQNVPPTLAKVFIALSREKVIQAACHGMTFELAASYTPKVTDADYVRKSDVPWLDRFAEAGGHAIISGDKRMRQRPHERLALYQHGFVVIFFEAAWSQWTFFKKSALMLHWWPEITSNIRSAAKGTSWVVPSTWPLTDGQLRNVSFGLAKILKDSPDRKKIDPISVLMKPRRKQRVAETRQQNFVPLLEAPDAQKGD